MIDAKSNDVVAAIRDLTHGRGRTQDARSRQVTLVGSWTFSKQGQTECAEFVADRNVDVEKLFTHRWKLEQAEEAYKLLRRANDGQGRHPTVLREGWRTVCL